MENELRAILAAAFWGMEAGMYYVAVVRHSYEDGMDSRTGAPRTIEINNRFRVDGSDDAEALRDARRLVAERGQATGERGGSFWVQRVLLGVSLRRVVRVQETEVPLSLGV